MQFNVLAGFDHLILQGETLLICKCGAARRHAHGLAGFRLCWRMPDFDRLGVCGVESQGKQQETEHQPLPKTTHAESVFTVHEVFKSEAAEPAWNAGLRHGARLFSFNAPCWKP